MHFWIFILVLQSVFDSYGQEIYLGNVVKGEREKRRLKRRKCVQTDKERISPKEKEKEKRE